MLFLLVCFCIVDCGMCVLYCFVLLLFCRMGECSKGGGRCLEALRFASQELLAKAKEAKELQGDDLCSNGTWHLSGDFKAQSRFVSTHFFLVLSCAACDVIG